MIVSLRLRLILSHLVVIFVAMAAAGFLLLSFMERYLLQSLEDSLIAQGRIIAQVLIPSAKIAGPVIESQTSAYTALQSNPAQNFNIQTQNVIVPADPLNPAGSDLAYLNEASFQLSSQLDTQIRIVNDRGIVVADSGGGRGDDLSADPLVVQALQGRYSRVVGPASGEDNAALSVGLPIVSEGQVIGSILLSQSLRDTSAVLNDLRIRLLLSVGIALAVSALIGLLFSQAISGPIRQLTMTAEAISNGQPLTDLTINHPTSGNLTDELGRLRNAFYQMLTRLRLAQQLQTSFVADVSHELRTPLTSIKGLVETLQDGAMEDQTVRVEFLETISGETDRLTRLVNDLLTLSRIDAHAMALHREEIDLARLAGVTVGRMKPHSAARQIDICVQPNDRADSSLTLRVYADRDRVVQVLNNLLINAIQYSDIGGRVIVQVDYQAGEDWVRVKVLDEGIGIAAEALPRIGQRFFRADKARSRAKGGSGLGLAIARALIEAHGGQLEITSTEGRGTTASFTLPVYRPDQAQQAVANFSDDSY